MVGSIFITSSGYDPQRGKHVKDPYLGDTPTLGACRPDIRRQLKIGDHIFVISGKLQGLNQFVMGGFEIAHKMTALEAFASFPHLRLRRREDGQVTGNIIVDASGRRHKWDNHDLNKVDAFERRIQNYVVGKNPLTLATESEIALGREQTLDALREIFKKNGNSPFEIVGHYGTRLTESQVEALRTWLMTLKRGSRHRRTSQSGLQIFG